MSHLLGRSVTDALLGVVVVVSLAACKTPTVDIPNVERPAPTSSGTPVAPPSGTPAAAPAADTIAYSGSFGAGTGYSTLTVGGKARRVYTYVPASHPPTPALVVVYHGTGANVNDGAHDGAMGELGIREVAEANGFIVVAPFSTADGGVNADHEGGGDGWRFDGDADTNIDLALTRASIQEARRVYAVDVTHVYAIGHSNGAFFTYFAAMKLASRIAAFAETSGGLIACGNRIDCEFARAGTTSCAALLAAAPAACKCAIGATPFPTAKPIGRIPQGFLKHNADDSTVSSVYTCRLAEHLGARAQVTLDGAGEHGPTGDFTAKAWTFLASRSLAD